MTVPHRGGRDPDAYLTDAAPMKEGGTHEQGSTGDPTAACRHFISDAHHYRHDSCDSMDGSNDGSLRTAFDEREPQEHHKDNAGHTLEVPRFSRLSRKNKHLGLNLNEIQSGLSSLSFPGSSEKDSQECRSACDIFHYYASSKSDEVEWRFRWHSSLYVDQPVVESLSSYETSEKSNDSPHTIVTCNDSDHQWNQLLGRINALKNFTSVRRNGNYYPRFPNWYYNALNDTKKSSSCDQESPGAALAEDGIKGDERESDGLVPCVFLWPYPANNVFLSGNFPITPDHEGIPMVCSHDSFKIIISLPKGVYRYRFLVDGEWRVTPMDPAVTTEQHALNVLDISHYESHRFRLVTDYEKARYESYHQRIPDPKSYTHDPPCLPMLLRKSQSILCNTSTQNASLLYCLSNHIYLDREQQCSLGSDIICASTTSVWRDSHKLPLSTIGPRYSTLIYVTPNDAYCSSTKSLHLVEFIKSVAQELKCGYIPSKTL